MTGNALRVLAWPAFLNKPWNPYNWLLYTHLQKQGVSVEEFSFGKLLLGTYHIVHVHWPEWQVSHRRFTIAFLRFLRLIVILGVARAKGTRIVWTVHNMQCHENFHPRLINIFYKTFLPFVDGYISLSTANIPSIQNQFALLRSRPHTVTPHGHYRGAYPDGASKETARRILWIERNACVILHFGIIRPYKNVARLIKEFRKLDRKDCVLLVAGHPWNKEMEKEIMNASSGEPRIRLALRFVRDEEIQLFFQAADLVVLPFIECWNSGSAVLALSFSRPVILPAIESIVELQSLVGPDWIRTYEGPLSAEILDGGIEWGVRSDRHGEVPLESINWDSIATSTKSFFLTLKGSQRCESEPGKRPA